MLTLSEVQKGHSFVDINHISLKYLLNFRFFTNRRFRVCFYSADRGQLLGSRGDVMRADHHVDAIEPCNLGLKSKIFKNK